MAYNVFGDPITNKTLEAMPEFHGKEITRRDRAQVALKLQKDKNKYEDVLAYVRRLKGDWGTGVSTLCIFYNATGDTIKYECDHNWHGHIGPGPYPIEIENGQWGGFLHVKTSGAATGSGAACVYRGKNNDNDVCDWMAAWNNPWNRASWGNTAYTEIREEGHYSTNKHWDHIANQLYKSGLTHSSTWNKCKSTVVTESDTSPKYEAVFTLADA